MTETTDIAAIRERADAYRKAWFDFGGLNYFDPRFEQARRVLDVERVSAPADREALLAIVDELTARAEAAEAALRPFAALRADYLKYAEEQKAAGIPRWQMSDFTAWIDHFGADPDMLMQSCKQAADALAAHAANGESAGNGGA